MVSMTAGEPLVSICVPAYRRPKLIAELLSSVTAQTYQRWELFVSDNSDDDSTERVVAGFRDPRIGYWRNSTNIGIGRNVRKVVASANGSYFTFTPDDDLWAPTNLERKVAFLERHPHVPVVFSNAQRIDFAGGPLPPFRSSVFAGERLVNAAVLQPSVQASNPHFLQIATAVMRTSEAQPAFLASFLHHTEEYFMWWLSFAASHVGLIGDQLVSLREAEHFRTTVQGGRVVNLAARSKGRQRQLFDIHRTLVLNHPELGEGLENPAVTTFVGQAVIRCAAGPSGVAFGLAKAMLDLPGASLGALTTEALRRLGGWATAWARRPRPSSGIGSIEPG